MLSGQNDASGSTGLPIEASNSTVKGLVIQQFSTGIVIRDASFVTISGNYIGTDSLGSVSAGTQQIGIFVNGGLGGYTANNNTIGGTTIADRNVISGNTEGGIEIVADAKAKCR